MTTETVLPAGPDAALARLAAGVAHELRNPLAVILARAQLLSIGLRQGRLPDADKLERTLKTIEDQAVRASHVVESLSAFARPRKPKLESLDLAETLTTAIAGARGRCPRAAAVTVDVTVAPEAATVVADREQLAIALGHLVENALEATGAQGTVRVRAERRHDAVVIVIADEGPGIPAQDVERLFEPFFSTKPGAAGLGLPVAQTVAELHGGHVRFAATDVVGAECVLTLPQPGGAA